MHTCCLIWCWWRILACYYCGSTCLLDCLIQPDLLLLYLEFSSLVTHSLLLWNVPHGYPMKRYALPNIRLCQKLAFASGKNLQPTQWPTTPTHSAFSCSQSPDFFMDTCSSFHISQLTEDSLHTAYSSCKISFTVIQPERLEPLYCCSNITVFFFYLVQFIIILLFVFALKTVCW